MNVHLKALANTGLRAADKAEEEAWYERYNPVDELGDKIREGLQDAGASATDAALERLAYWLAEHRTSMLDKAIAEINKERLPDFSEDWFGYLFGNTRFIAFLVSIVILMGVVAAWSFFAKRRGQLLPAIRDALVMWYFGIVAYIAALFLTEASDALSELAIMYASTEGGISDVEWATAYVATPDATNVMTTLIGELFGAVFATILQVEVKVVFHLLLLVAIGCLWAWALKHAGKLGKKLWRWAFSLVIACFFAKPAMLAVLSFGANQIRHAPAGESTLGAQNLYVFLAMLAPIALFIGANFINSQIEGRTESEVEGDVGVDNVPKTQEEAHEAHSTNQDDGANLYAQQAVESTVSSSDSPVLPDELTDLQVENLIIADAVNHYAGLSDGIPDPGPSREVSVVVTAASELPSTSAPKGTEPSEIQSTTHQGGVRSE